MTVTDSDAVRLESQLTRLHTLALALAAAVSVAAVAGAIIDSALPALDAVGGLVAGLDEAGGTLTLLRSEGYVARELPVGAALSLEPRSALAEAVRGGAPLLLGRDDERWRTDPLIAALEPEPRRQTGLVAVLPLQVGGSAVGAIVAALAAGRGRAPGDSAFMTIVAQQCGQALERARLSEAAEGAIAARVAVEQQMEDGRRQVLRLLTGIADAFFALDRDWRYTYVNPAAAAMQGRQPEELVGRTIWEASPRAAPSPFADAARRVMATGEFARSEHRSAIDGAWYESLIYPMPEGILVFGRDISAQKQVEEHLRRLADAMPQIVWESGPDGVVDYVNRRWYDFASAPVGGDFATQMRQLTHPDDAARVRPLWQQALATGEPFEAQYRLFDQRTSAYRWFLDRAVCTCDDHGAIERWFGTLTDIDVDKRRQETLARQARLLDLTYDAIFVRDLESRIVYWNAGAQALYGYRAADVEGQNSHELLQTELPPSLSVPLDALIRRDGIWEGELTHRRRDGSRVVVDSRQVLMFDAAGDPAAILETNRDATRRKQAEAERAAFVSSITHDLKNPLATIKGQAQLLSRRAARGETLDAERLQAGLAAIDATATRMTAMLTELLDVSQLQTGQTLDLALAPVELVSLVRGVAQHVQAGTDRHTIIVQSDVAELPGVWDAARLERVVGNVLSNAVKYSPDGGTIMVRLSADQPAGGRPCAVLSVSDAGVGIPAADLPHVFDWFFRARNVSGRFAGSGMGLPGSKRIVDQHGGSMSVESREGSGSTVTIRLPLA
jgi:PAS domain S-box-containing protein